MEPEQSGTGGAPPAPNVGMLRALRVVLAVVWIAALAAQFTGGDGTAWQALRLLFWGLLAVHAVECLVFWRALRASGRPIAGQVVQVLLFGVVHYGLLQAETAARPPASG